MKKPIFTVLTFLLVSTLFISIVSALRLNTSNDLNIDSTIIKDDQNFGLPTRIIITPIYLPSSDSNVREDDWFRGLFYYTIDVLGFNDIPYHYVVSKTGTVYSGNTGGYERELSINGVGSDMILIGYMSDKFASQIDNRAKDDLVELLTKVASENNIDPTNIQIKGTKFQRNEQNKTVVMVEDDLFGLWNISLLDIIEGVQKNYNPVVKIYSVNVDSVSVPENNLAPGSEIIIPITITNTSDFGIYSGTDAEMLLSRVNGENSNYFINNVWLSQSQMSLMSDGDVLQTFDTGEFSVKIKTPLIVGEYSETFEIRNINGDLISDDSIELKVNIVASDREIVEILTTETGTLNVRDIPSSVGDTINQVSEGERFFKTDDAGNGWIEVELEDGTRGWIAGWYTRTI
ncbi:MAG: SH3 domain-containing protein [Candidatus Dojkabacteria bacterium]|nr:SH3 domain-containing protein [Candidatus Dojkabacteria bacterium]MDQ7020592.1 SH3 domain-containing protein [Candidatus Dojkabacteria bacterium]